MKKLLILMVSLLFAFTAKAQLNMTDAEFRLGLTAYPTFGKISAENGKSKGTNLGFAYGLMADLNFTPHYSLNTGLTIMTINAKSTEINALPYHSVVSSINAIPYELKYKMQYLEIPLALKLKTNEIGALRWYGQFGLTNGFRIKARQDAANPVGSLADNRNSADWTNFYRAGIIIGGGTEYTIDGNTSLMLGLTFNNAITKLTTEDRMVKNHYFALQIGVFF